MLSRIPLSPQFYIFLLLLGSLSLGVYYLALPGDGTAVSSQIQNGHLVAHAGGGIHGMTYTNSLEAINENYDLGIRLFELDFCLTRDNHLVAVHDWENYIKTKFQNAKGRMSLLEFEQAKMINGLHQLTLEGVIAWLRDRRDAYIITDIKDSNQKGLEIIKAMAPSLYKRFIPQIYEFEEYDMVKRLGFPKIILTLYRIGNWTPEQIVSFVAKDDVQLFAITMWANLALERNRTKELTKNNIFIFAHTVNDFIQYEALRNRGVGGVYTDFLTPDKTRH